MANDDPFDFNQTSSPYASPADFERMPRQRSGGLTALCVIAIVLGALGLLGSLIGLVSVAFQNDIEKLVTRQPEAARGDMPKELRKGVPKDAQEQIRQMQQQLQQRTKKGMPNGNPMAQMQETQRRLQQKQFEVAHRYRGATLGLTLFNLLVSASLLVGGILALNFSPAGRTLLLTVFLAAIVFEIIRAIVTVSMQLDMGAAMASAFQDGANDPGMASLMKAATYGGMAFGILWGTAKIVFYAIGASYLRRPKISRLFVPSTNRL